MQATDNWLNSSIIRELVEMWTKTSMISQEICSYDYPNGSGYYVHWIEGSARNDKSGIAYIFSTQNNMDQSGK